MFRNESVDRTHLAEFHQIEGIYKLHAPVLVLSFLLSRSSGYVNWIQVVFNLCYTTFFYLKFLIIIIIIFLGMHLMIHWPSGNSLWI